MSKEGQDVTSHIFAGWQRGGDTSGPSYYWQGNDTLKVPRSMHAQNRQRLVSLMDRKSCKGVALLLGGTGKTRDDSDHEEIFRQESNFHYLFGVAEPDCLGAIDVRDGSATLFIPRLPADYAMWMGPIASPEDFKKKYEVEAVRYVDEIPAFVAEFAPETLFLYEGVNTDSRAKGTPATFEGIEAYAADREVLHEAVYEARVIKSELELEVMRFANKVSSDAHIAVMRQVRAGMMEYQMESIFLHHCYSVGGMRHQAYTAICGCGPNSSVLHYGHAGAPNNRKLGRDQMVLNDMGNEYYCYSSDITCSFPVSGVFTPQQRSIYEAVLETTVEVMSALRPGVEWFDMHELAERVLARHLIALGFLHGTVEDVMAVHLPAVFMPHGLGHLMGIDTHDVGGYPKGAERAQRPGLRNIRLNRRLEEGMVVTVEPGCYFINHFIEEALSDEARAKYMDAAKVRGMVGFGGVRIEDDIIITSDGMELMTNVPRTVKEVEAVMSGMDFPLEDSDYPIPRNARWS
eukprot:CAMPEP_0174918464 /NCGR_PEP_ID=MMETSP1355-20121228/3087_1 /TAXON_ID=464990 /ORGANISM="Hemiselmis tepida, Strain CCMP443" /LENGTH=516 /DNA_ID=CAMNT_0016163641 /DNA_START=48 /DNA_END=1595 /DNA_ORIENTATION=-